MQRGAIDAASFPYTYAHASYKIARAGGLVHLEHVSPAPPSAR